MSSHGNDTDSFGNKRPEKLEPSDAISLHKPKSIVERRTSNFSRDEPNTNEQNLLFSLISIELVPRVLSYR